MIQNSKSKFAIKIIGVLFLSLILWGCSASPAPAGDVNGIAAPTQTIITPAPTRSGGETPPKIDQPNVEITPKDEVILLTGFEPFGERRLNSSWETVKLFDGRLLGGQAKIIAVQLPVVWREANDEMIQAIKDYQPMIIINVGQGNGVISLESTAQNLNEMIPDNDGLYPITRTIKTDGAAYYRTRIDLTSIQARLEKEGIGSIVSDNAGGYLCNFVSYHAYYYLSQQGSDTPIVFIHLPPITTAKELDELGLYRALEIIIDEIYAQETQ